MAADAGASEQRPRKERAENAAKRRQQIVDATISSIDRNGLAATTLATVAQAAGLSQGVAVFYFKNKQALLAETLRRVYQDYRATWQRAISEAGDDPLDRIVALVRADFDASVCNRRTLAVWHAFWGEASARPIFAEISKSFDDERAGCMRECCMAASADMAGGWDPVVVGDSIDSLTDGFWHRIHLAGGVGFDRETAFDMTLQFMASVFPGRREEILKASPKR
ncbi:TetR family transcriptional regulator C-terminal domain-containing protein [Lutibaculum baratangense]|uniref:Transcriptional regulator n=1 Tax=Lutibaculum baratangense AMV1 TaxID=631454 RepID=V4RGQ5_9HYPH|nr:TetR family transcriptional regulator C-terminal domain-containing protein [Lutibaculum baratangense]ESR24534.1 transcriptional regulator [Lutibaculum baratangense AMV1]